jgi:signal transduction histidine kinase/CheY-like chemotaxis protein
VPAGDKSDSQPAFDERISLDQQWALLERAQEVAHIGSWVAELDGSDRLRWSAETYRIFEIGSGQFARTSEAFFALVHPDDVAGVRAASRAAIEAHVPYNIEHRIVTGTGVVRWVHEKADIERGPDDTPIRMIGTVQDVTDRRQLESQLRHSQKMEAIGRLAGGIAHDLNNALTTIAGYTDLALSSLDDNHPARRDVEEIRRAAARAESVTRQLLAFSRRRQLFELREFDLNRTITGLARLLERTLGDNTVLRTMLAPNLPPVMGDSGQIEQAIVNLVVNARDAMPGGGEVTIRTATQTVSEAFARSHAPMSAGRFIVLSVSDTGHGIARDAQARIFEPFFTTKEAGKGTGLGLAMVYGTIKQCSGFIFVESDVGRGATFQLYFPLHASHNVTESRRTAEERVRTVMIVEDEPSILNLVAATLAPEGYQLVKATSGRHALEQLASLTGPLDLLLTDATMPGMSGGQLACELLAANPTLRVIIMSGQAAEIADIESIRDSVMTLQKPFTPTELRARIRERLDAPA